MGHNNYWKKLDTIWFLLMSHFKRKCPDESNIWGRLEIWKPESYKISGLIEILRTSLVAQIVKNLPTIQENWVQSLGREDSLEKRMATHTGILAWRISWMEESGRLQSMGRKEADMTELSGNFHFQGIKHWNVRFPRWHSGEKIHLPMQDMQKILVPFPFQSLGFLSQILAMWWSSVSWSLNVCLACLPCHLWVPLPCGKYSLEFDACTCVSYYNYWEQKKQV